MTFMLYPSLTERTVNVHVVGAGGTGSQVLTGLAHLNHAMRELGHPGGLHVTVWDDDRVSDTNIGRQVFFPSDVGLPKAVVLVNRINMTMGTNWEAAVSRFTASSLGYANADLIIGCVDTRASRASILEALSRRRNCNTPSLWLDIGNSTDTGQVVLGEVVPQGSKLKKCLPHAGELFPEVVDAKLDAVDVEPTCSLAEALAKQALFVNRGVAVFALDLLWQLFRHGQIGHHGVFLNLKAGRTNPIPVCDEAWKRMGYPPVRIRKRKTDAEKLAA